MVNFIEYASKAQEELNKERGGIQAREGALQTKGNELAGRSAELDKREADIVQKEKDLAIRTEQLAQWEGKKKREEEVQSMFDDANAKLLEAQKIMRKVSEETSDTDQKRADLLKRENELSNTIQTYKAEVQKDLLDKFFKGRLQG